jgi:hypothetical protein
MADMFYVYLLHSIADDGFYIGSFSIPPVLRWFRRWCKKILLARILSWKEA